MVSVRKVGGAVTILRHELAAQVSVAHTPPGYRGFGDDISGSIVEVVSPSTQDGLHNAVTFSVVHVMPVPRDRVERALVEALNKDGLTNLRTVAGSAGLSSAPALRHNLGIRPRFRKNSPRGLMRCRDRKSTISPV